jgi:hypothetical protein
MHETAIEEIQFTGLANDLALRPHGWRDKPRDNIIPHRNRLMDAPLGSILIDDAPAPPLHLEINVEKRRIKGRNQDELKLLFLIAGTKAVVWEKTLSDGKLPGNSFFFAARAFANLSRLNQRPLPVRQKRKIHLVAQSTYTLGTTIFTKLIEQDDQGRRLTLLDQGRGQKGKLAQSIFTLCAFSLR